MEQAIVSRRLLVVTVAALIFGPVLMIGPLAGAVVLVVCAPVALTTVAGAIMIAGASPLIAYHMLQNYHWVEFDGDLIRGRRFWTRQLIEYRTEDVVNIRALGATNRFVTNLVIDEVLGPVRGYEICFRSGPSIGLIRHDMTGVDELVGAVLVAVKSRSAGPGAPAGADRPRC